MPDDTPPISPLGLGLDEGVSSAPTSGTQAPTAPQPNPGADEPSQPLQSPPPPELVSEDETNLVVTASPAPKKFVSKRVIATILGILLLMGSVATGVYLVQRQQLTSTRAWDCKTYVFNVSSDGIVSIQNGSTRDEPSQQALVFINDTQVAVLDVPALKKGDAATLGSVSVPAGSFSWRVKGTKDCQNSGSYQVTPTPSPSSTPTPTQGPTPTASPSPTSTPTPTVTPTPPPIGAACLDVKAYDSQWNQLASSDLSNLKTGDLVRLTVGGTTTSGSFDKARFTVNGVTEAEVTAKRPGTDEFFDEYVIPEGTTSFNVSAQIHHSVLGWF